MHKLISIKNGYLLIAVSAILLSVSCKKDSDNKPNGSLQTFLANTTAVDTTLILKAGSFELGNRFSASRNGTITHLGCLMPYKGLFRVSLWDAETKELMTAVQVKSDSV